MPSHSEVFYLHVGGEQRGPYTTRQIDHQLNSGLIGDDTLYWREGMEQWQPVTDLVARRKGRKPGKARWGRRIALLALLVPVALLGRVFGPIALVGWRETAQYDFTPLAAYWRARDSVRHQALPPGTVIAFFPMKPGDVELNADPPGAKVRLSADVGTPQTRVHRQAWSVALDYSAPRKEWTGREFHEEAP